MEKEWSGLTNLILRGKRSERRRTLNSFFSKKLCLPHLKLMSCCKECTVWLSSPTYCQYNCVIERLGPQPSLHILSSWETRQTHVYTPKRGWITPSWLDSITWYCGVCVRLCAVIDNNSGLPEQYDSTQQLYKALPRTSQSLSLFVFMSPALFCLPV